MKKYLILLLFMLSLLYAANPSRAMLYSALIPGGGQFYNGAYLKAGVVIGLQAYLLGHTLYLDSRVQDYKVLMKDTLDPYLLQQYRDKLFDTREARTSNIWWMAITGTLSILDAYVDAHLADFDADKEGLHLRFADEKLMIQYKF